MLGADVHGLQHRHRAGGVEQRRHDEVHVVEVQRHDHLHVDRVGDQVAVGEDDALARSRRAAGVEEAGGFVLVHRGVVERRPRRGGDEFVVLAVVDADHAIDEVGERARVAIGDEDPRAGIRERVRQLRLGPAEVERHLRPPTGRDAAVELHERIELNASTAIRSPAACPARRAPSGGVRVARGTRRR